MNTYQSGNTIVLSAQFSAVVGGAPVDPTSVTLRVVDPNGVETDYTTQITKLGTGSYTYALQVLTSGYWNYRWEGLGAVFAALESRFLVSQTAFTNPQ